MKILQITDPHLYGSAAGHLRGVETDSSLRVVLDEAFAATADYGAILVTGDLVQDDPSGYLRFKSILAPRHVPVLCIPGNHDDPDAMRLSLDDAPFRYCGTHAFGAWQIVMLDSYYPGHVGGRLTQGELDRLDAALGASRAHTLVCLHHHPVPMQSAWLDRVGLAEPEAFWRIIDSHPTVRGVAWGHVHQEHHSMRNGVHLFATPSTCAQFVPHSHSYTVDSRSPAYRSFTLEDDGRIASAVRWVKPAALPAAAG